MRRILRDTRGAAGMLVLRIGKTAFLPLLSLAVVIAHRDRFDGIEGEAVLVALRSITLTEWLAAFVLTAISYWSLGRFDAICHRILRTGQPMTRARHAGMAAFALSQTLGLGILTGGLARWRLLPGLTPARALALSAVSGLGFMAVWAWLLLIAIGWQPELEPALDAALAPGLAADLDGHAQGLAVAAGLAALLLALWPTGAPRQLRRWLRLRGVGVRSLGGLAFFAALDMAAAAGVLHILMPQDLALPYTAFLPLFLIALGSGLIAGTPAGVGAFELSLLMLMPAADPVVLMAAIAGYRLIYFVLPACLAMGAMARPDWLAPRHPLPPVAWHTTPMPEGLPPDMDSAIETGGLAEAHLARQPGLGLLWSAGSRCGAVVGTAGRSLAMIRDPFPAADTASVLDGLAATARERGLTPCLYKCSARTAVLARRRGYRAIRVAREAWLDPARYDLAARSRRQLRRKLRHAETAGVRFETALAETLPLGPMHAINMAWSRQHGGERGFSMGRFHPALIVRQRVFLAWQDGQLIGFVSFHAVAGEWSLDLLRPAPGAPDGTAHGLIDQALRSAAEARVPRLSLAAAPLESEDTGDQTDSPLARLQHKLSRRTGGLGLARFKSMFDPNWSTLYIAAPTRLSLLRAGAEIARAIAAPPPMPR